MTYDDDRPSRGVAPHGQPSTVTFATETFNPLCPCCTYWTASHYAATRGGHLDGSPGMPAISSMLASWPGPRASPVTFAGRGPCRLRLWLLEHGHALGVVAQEGHGAHSSWSASPHARTAGSSRVRTCVRAFVKIPIRLSLTGFEPPKGTSVPTPCRGWSAPASRQVQHVDFG
jgi:hypothetical protein